MKSINGLELPYAPVWVNKHHTRKIGQSDVETLGNRLIIAQVNLKFERIPLAIPVETAWVTKAEAEAVLELANVANAIYPFEWDGESFNVMFDHSNNAVVFDRVWQYDDLDMAGSINLVRVQ